MTLSNNDLDEMLASSAAGAGSLLPSQIITLLGDVHETLLELKTLRAWRDAQEAAKIRNKRRAVTARENTEHRKFGTTKRSPG